jgi:hypothetical protein
METTVLAEGIVRSRHEDGSISLGDLQLWLCRAGFEELAHAAGSLLKRLPRPAREAPGDQEHPWF